MSTNFANFIDELRQARKMSREDLVDGIISLRQYYRFQKGENSLKSDVIEQLLSRLHMNHLNTYRYFFNEYNETSKELEQVYPLIYNRKFIEARKLLDKIDSNKLIYESQKVFHEILTLILDVESNKTPYDTACEKVIKLIDYPKILENEIISFHETVGLIFIIKKLLKNKDTRLAEMAYKMITNQDNNSTNFLKYAYRLPFYVDTSRMLGYLDKYDESLAVAKISIEEIFNNGDMVMLMYFYMLIALGYKKLNNEKYKDYIRKLYMLLYIEGNPNRTKEFTEQIEKIFMLKESDLIEYK